MVIATKGNAVGEKIASGAAKNGAAKKEKPASGRFFFFFHQVS